MGSLLEELTRREAAVRQRIEEIRERIAELNGLLEAEEDRLSRLVITRETVEEILGEAARLVEEPAGEAGSVEAVEAGAASPLGVVTVPPWRPGMTVSVLPTAYRDAVEILADAAEAMRAGRIAAAMGLADSAAKREGLRSKLKRLRCSRWPSRWPARWPGRPPSRRRGWAASPPHRWGDCGRALPRSGSRVPAATPTAAAGSSCRSGPRPAQTPPGR